MNPRDAGHLAEKTIIIYVGTVVPLVENYCYLQKLGTPRGPALFPAKTCARRRRGSAWLDYLLIRSQNGAVSVVSLVPL